MRVSLDYPSFVWSCTVKNFYFCFCKSFGFRSSFVNFIAFSVINEFYLGNFFLENLLTLGSFICEFACN